MAYIIPYLLVKKILRWHIPSHIFLCTILRKMVIKDDICLDYILIEFDLFTSFNSSICFAYFTSKRFYDVLYCLKSSLCLISNQKTCYHICLLIFRRINVKYANLNVVSFFFFWILCFRSSIFEERTLTTSC